MQLRLVWAAAIYLGSYLPLSLMLLIQDMEFKATAAGCTVQRVQHLQCFQPLRHPVPTIVFVATCSIGFLVTLAIIRLLPKKQKVQITEYKHIPADLINYTFPYILSFAALDFEDTGKTIGFIVFLGWIFWITHRSGQIIMNPVLAALGWKLYEIKYSFLGNNDVYVGRMLSRCAIIVGGHYDKGDLQDVLVAKPEGI